MENMIKDFLRGSIKNTLADYDFVAFFDEFKPVLHQKLTEHGLTTLEEYTVYMEDIETLSDENLEQFTIQTDYVYFGTEDVRQAIAKGQYEACQKAFSSMFEDLQILHEKLENYSDDNTCLKDKIILFDECIHAEHCNGDILENLSESIDDIKELIDKEYADGLLA